MFTLVTDKSEYFRVKRGQSGAEVENALSIPVAGKVFAGRIIKAGKRKYTRYTAGVGDTYKTVARAFRVSEEELKAVNGNKPVYPTCKLFVPEN